MYASAIIASTHLYTHDLDLPPLTLKTFQRPTHIIIIIIIMIIINEYD